MTTRIDVLIPTLKPRKAVAAQAAEIAQTAGIPVTVQASCLIGSASVNRNWCLQRVRSEVFVMLDDDVTGFSAGWVRRMVEVIEQNPKCVMLTAELLDSKGAPGPMMGGPPRNPGVKAVSLVKSRRLVTACFAAPRWPSGISFDENFIGSGFEDNDICQQLRCYFPDGEWQIVHDVVVTHLNEMKNQRGDIFQRNRQYYEQKWKVQWGND